MSQNCIEYSDYKKIIEQQNLTPRKNIFEQNRILVQQVNLQASQNKVLQNKIQYYRNLCNSIVDAIGRVFSKQLAKQLQDIINGYENQKQVSMMGQSIYEVLATHQSQMTVSDWSQSRRSSLRTPQKFCDQNSNQLKSYRNQSFRNSKKLSPFLNQKQRSLSRSPLSASLNNSLKDNDPSTNRSNTPSVIIATGINCQLCQQTFAPNQFIQHASRCKDSFIQSQSQSQYSYSSQCHSQESNSISNYTLNINTQQQSLCSQQIQQLRKIDLQDTQDRKLKNQSQNYLNMMKNLIKIQKEIQEQIQMLRFSKQKIDRDTEKRKLQKDLAKVMYVIEQKKRQVKDKQKGGSKLAKSKKNASKLRN